MPAATKDQAPFVSVIMPHYQDVVALAACLDSLETQTWPRDGFEIIVADNNSPVGLDAVEAAVRGRAKVVLVTEKGAGPARNGAVAASRGDVLAFIDSDCVAEPQWLAEGVAALQGSDFVGGAVRVLVADETAMTPAEAFERVFAFDNETYVRRKGFTVTANLFCPRAVFDAVGGFRVGVPEDLEWCHRAGAMGFRIGYAAHAAVGHPARRTWSELRRKWRRLTEEAFGLAQARPGGRLKWLLRSLVTPVTAVPHSLKVLASPALCAPRDRWNALRTLYRLRLTRAADGIVLMARRG